MPSYLARWDAAEYFLFFYRCCDTIVTSEMTQACYLSLRLSNPAFIRGSHSQGHETIERLPPLCATLQCDVFRWIYISVECKEVRVLALFN